MADVRWLDDDEQKAWRAFITATVLITRALDKEMRDEHGLSLDDYAILALTSEAPGQRLRFGELAQALRAPKAHVTYRSQRLRELGLVERIDCPEDGRGAYCELTPKGRRAIEDAAPTHVAGVRTHLLDHLSANQRDALGQACDAVLDGHAATCPETPPLPART
ncbi:MAG: MarR family transcriptional regulator [Acidimicrobiia bacterium]|nr:MarR family transcriptional regulator [Acidimicrobiia bacterium]